MAGRKQQKPMVKPESPERIVVGLSGASGVAYGIRLLEALHDLGLESHLVMTKPAEMTIAYETKLTPKQAQYLGIPVGGPFKPEHYRY